MAFGLDRLCTILGGETSIRNYIAFPKNNQVRVVDSPTPLMPPTPSSPCLFRCRHCQTTRPHHANPASNFRLQFLPPTPVSNPCLRLCLYLAPSIPTTHLQGRDVMIASPSPLTPAQLEELSIDTIQKVKDDAAAEEKAAAEGGASA